MFASTPRQFERLVRRYQHRVYGYACYFLGDPEEAADVTQEVLLRFWNHRREVEEERLLAWLLRVTRNACVDALRRRRTYRRAMAVDTEYLEQVPGLSPTPEAVAERLDFQSHLLRALGTLEEPYRSIVILREVQDLKYEEISEAMDLPLGTVKVYLHRGRKKLREALSKVIERETA